MTQGIAERILKSGLTVDLDAWVTSRTPDGTLVNPVANEDGIHEVDVEVTLGGGCSANEHGGM